MGVTTIPFDSNGIWSLTPGYLAVAGNPVIPTNHNPPLEDISTNGLSAVLVKDGRAPMTGPLNMGTTNKIVNLAAGTAAADAVNFSQLAGAGLTGAQNQGMIAGLTLSNNATDTTNDIDIAVGSAAADVTPFNIMSLSSILTKRLDAAWAVGSGNGGLDTGSIANTTYHVWLIQRSDTGVVDALFSTSATSPTMPTNYDRKRRIGSIVRASATIRPFKHSGDRFIWSSAKILDVSVVNPGTSAVTRTLSVPVGVEVDALITVLVGSGTSSSISCLVTSLDEVDRAPSNTDFTHTSAANNMWVGVQTTVKTNTSAQIRSRQSASGVADQFLISTLGYIDMRGRV